MKLLWVHRSVLVLCIVGYLPARFILGFLPLKWHDASNVALALIALLMWGWVAVVAVWNFRQGENSSAPLPYDRLTTEDYARWFLAMWAGWSPLATRFEIGFLIASLVVFATVVSGCAIACVELWRHLNHTHPRKESPLGVGMAVFVYFACSWELQAVRIHAGVPIPGHFLESPSYEFECEATLQKLNSGSGSV